MQISMPLEKRGVFQYELPLGLLRMGGFIISSSVVLLFLITWLLEYNETVDASITLTTKNLPLDIYAETEGELLVFVEENEVVKKGDVLAMIENSGSYEDMQSLKKMMASQDTYMATAKYLNRSARQLNLGAVQPALADLVKHYKRYRTFLSTDDHRNLRNSKKEQIEHYKKRIALMQQKSSLIAKDIGLSDKKLNVDQKLYEEEIISRRDLDRSRQNHLGKSHDALDNEVIINGLELEIKNLHYTIKTLNNQFKINSAQLKQNIEDALFSLENEIRTWENQHLILASTSGICTHKEYLNDYQFFQKGEKIFTIIPEKAKEHFGWLKLPVKGAGKVNVGQAVNVQLDNYPPSEYGILKGTIEEIAVIPSEGTYNVKVNFPEKLVSTFNVPFVFQQLMSGKAEVITNKTTFLQRLWNQTRAARLNR